jgi:hypothetical protein
MINETATQGEIAKLIAKSALKKISVDEQSILDAWVNQSPENKEFFEVRCAPDRLKENLIALLEMDDLAIARKASVLIGHDITGGALSERFIDRMSFRIWRFFFLLKKRIKKEYPFD